MKNISRREFTKMGAVGAASMASMAMFGCSSGSDGATSASAGANSGSQQSGDAAGSASGSATNASGANGFQTDDPKAPVVYYIKDINGLALVSAYNAIGFTPEAPCAVKLSMGEPGGNNYLQPGLVKQLIDEITGTIVECNTAYGGKRSTTESHMQTAEEHGFAAIAPVVIMDAEGSISLPVPDGKFLKEDLVGAAFRDFPSFLSLAHFKGHAMGGFGGAIKNCSIGIASTAGKLLIHSAGQSSTSWITAPQDDFLESMAEAAMAVSNALNGSIAYINVANNLSVDCDCDSNPAPPCMEDLGIYASFDPVAVDQACVDAVYAAPDGSELVERIESKNGTHLLEYAEQIGLGSRNYKLVTL